MVRTEREVAENETAPLLGRDGQSHGNDARSRKFLGFLPFTITRVPVTTLVPALGVVTVFMNEAEFYIKQPAQLRALEALACLEYYTSLNDPLARQGKQIPELTCKSKPIQERVATLYGILYAIRSGSAFIGTFVILWWFKAGKRRPIIVLHKFVLVISSLLIVIGYLGYPRLPIWFMTLTGLPLLFGGNFDLGTSTLFAAYADVIDDPTRRSSLIFITSSLQYAAQAICAPLSGRLINLNGRGSTPEISLYISSACTFAMFVLVALFFPETFVPETGQTKSKTRGEAGVKKARRSLTHTSEERADDTAPESSPASTNPLYVLRKDFGLSRVFFLLLATFCSIASTRTVDWTGMTQYPSIKFHWTYTKTTYLSCMQAVLSFINFAFILPRINKLCQRNYNISARSTSIGIVMASALLLSVCSVVFGLPGTTVVIFVVTTAVYTLGSGVNSALQTYTVSVASTPRSAGAALTIMSLAATAGKVAASIIWPLFLSIGLENSSGKLAGLPFFVVAILFAIVTVSTYFADQMWKIKRAETRSTA